MLQGIVDITSDGYMKKAQEASSKTMADSISKQDIITEAKHEIELAKLKLEESQRKYIDNRHELASLQHQSLLRLGRSPVSK